MNGYLAVKTVGNTSLYIMETLHQRGATNGYVYQKY